MSPFIGCAGWSINVQSAAAFPVDGSHLERYAARFNAVEINSSFYRPHQPKTYARWAESTPPGFHFAVKIPKRITHELRLRDAAETLDQFRNEVLALGDKLGPLLVQLPPSLAFEPPQAKPFLRLLRERFDTPIVCEPRHLTWFTAAAESILAEYRIGRVAASPALVPAAETPAGWDGIAYFRLHGSPRMYYSSYDAAYLTQLAGYLSDLAAAGTEAWCIFDNTAAGAAVQNGLELRQYVKSHGMK